MYIMVLTESALFVLCLIGVYIYMNNRIMSMVPTKEVIPRDAAKKIIADGTWICLSRYMDGFNQYTFKDVHWGTVAEPILPIFTLNSDNVGDALDQFCKASDNCLTWTIQYGIHGDECTNMIYLYFEYQCVGLMSFNETKDGKFFNLKAEPMPSRLTK